MEERARALSTPTAWAGGKEAIWRNVASGLGLGFSLWAHGCKSGFGFTVRVSGLRFRVIEALHRLAGVSMGAFTVMQRY